MNRQGALFVALLSLAVLTGLCLYAGSRWILVSGKSAGARPRTDTETIAAATPDRLAEGGSQTLPTPDWMARMETYDPRLDTEQADAFLARHGRSADNLIAAGLATGDAAYLSDALAQAPDDPSVLFIVAQRGGDSPLTGEDTDRALDALAAIAPANGAVQHLRVLKLMRAGEVDAATALLQRSTDQAAAGELTWDNYLQGVGPALETLYRETGIDTLSARFIADGMLTDTRALGGFNTAELRQYIAGMDPKQAAETGFAAALHDYAAQWAGCKCPARFHQRELAQLSGEALAHLAASDPNWAAELHDTTQQVWQYEQDNETLDWLARHLDAREAALFLDQRQAEGPDRAMTWLKERVGERAGALPASISSAPHR